MATGNASQHERIPHRLAHLDLKGMPPHPDRLVQWLDVISASGYTGLLMEWEDCFPWELDQRFRSETAYDRAFVEQFHREAQTRQLEVVPLVQSLGHMEMVLRFDEYAHLREVAHRYEGAKPCSDEMHQLIVTMIDEVLATMPKPTYFHLGGDEAWAFGQHADNQDFLKEHGSAALFTAHYRPLFQALKSRGIRPIIWHDMLRGWTDEQVRALADQTDVMAWGYKGHPDDVALTATHHRRHMDQLARCDVQLWGAGAFKGADHLSTDRPDANKRLSNALAWSQVARRYNMQGVVATGWSRFDTLRPQCDPTEGCLDVMAAVGNVLRDGEVADSTLDHWTQKLVEMGYTDLPALKTLLSQFSAKRDIAWILVRQLREQLSTLSTDPCRQSLALPPRDRSQLKEHLAELTAIAEQLRPLLEDKTPGVWIERYLAERLNPLREEFNDIEQQAETPKVQASSPQPIVSAEVTCNPVGFFDS